MTHSPELAQLFDALAKAQSEMTVAEKDIEGYGYKYANSVGVWNVSRPSLTKYGISVAQHVQTNEQGNFELVTIVGHSSGEWMSSTVRMHIDPKFEKKSPQGIINIQAIGSAISYFRRYCYAPAVGVIAGDDDDGAAANHVPNDHKNAVQDKPKDDDPEGFLTFEEAASLDAELNLVREDIRELVAGIVKSQCNVERFDDIRFKHYNKALAIIKREQ